MYIKTFVCFNSPYLMPTYTTHIRHYKRESKRIIHEEVYLYLGIKFPECDPKMGIWLSNNCYVLNKAYGLFQQSMPPSWAIEKGTIHTY